ncbi:hypothetical protein [Pedobacter insulae]|nr:hypothetical protein [Pedobacter insulae]
MNLPSKKEITKIITILLFGTILSSCSKEDDPKNVKNEEPLISKMTVDPFNPNSGDVKDLIFDYDSQKRLIKKTGGFIQVPVYNGFIDVFTKDVYVSLIYNDNKVTVSELSGSSLSTIARNPSYYTLNNSNKIAQREIPNKFNSLIEEKQSYIYSGNNLVEIETYLKSPRSPIEPGDFILTYSEKFYYDSNNNLIKTEYLRKNNGIEKGEKIVRTFEDYDRSINPTKRFFLLDEYFYRSLSKNNFRKYTEVRSVDGILNASIERKWTFIYDGNGNIIIN